MNQEQLDKNAEIIVIDDSQETLFFLTEILKENKYQARPFLEGKPAFTYILSNYSKIGLILLDVRIPDIDGITLCEKIKSYDKTSEIPVIFISSLHQTQEKIRGFSSGCVDYIGKPFNIEEVLVRVATHFKFYQLQKLLQQQNCLQAEKLAFQNLELQQVNQELFRALSAEKELNEMKSQIITTISHEYRTPLTVILSSAEMLSAYRDRWDEKKQDKYFQRIKNSVNQLIDLLEDTLFISEIKANRIKPNTEYIDIESFCLSILADIKLISNERHNFNFEYNKMITSSMNDAHVEDDEKGKESKEINQSSDKTSYVLTDERLLRQILINLLSNAVKYSPDGGAIAFKVNLSKDEITFDVTDNGIGIPEYEIDNLFEEFVRGSNIGTIGGTGMGLAIVKHCTDALKGKISVQSQVDKGTTFTAVIPCEVSS